METTVALQQARDLVEAGWCQMAAARTGKGVSVFAASQSAATFCATGALMRVTWPWDDEDDEQLWLCTEECFDVLARVIREEYGWDMSEHTPWHVINEWNDEPARTKDEVLALFDRALEMARDEARTL